jgi:hypothetical protein
MAAEVALAMLLYGGTGMVRSLTTILGTLGLAFAGGLWSIPSGVPDIVDRLRRRWLFCLFAFLAAALFGTAWSLLPTVGEARWGQSAGLAILAALPAFAAGSVIGGIAEAARTDPGGRLRRPGAAAAMGAALGFVLTGLLLPRAPMPASLLIGCLVLLSLAGMVFGGVLGARTEIDVVARRASRNGEVRVQTRTLPIDGVAVREIWEADQLRRSMPLEADGSPPWDAEVARALTPPAGAPWRVLLIGGGASALPASVVREHPLGHVDVAERTAAVVELGREYFATDLAIPGSDRMAVAVGNLDDLVGMLETQYDLIVVDSAALALIGGAPGLSRATWWRLLDALAPGGWMALGPELAEEGVPAFENGWSARTYRRDPDANVLLACRAASHDVPWPTLFASPLPQSAPEGAGRG